MMYQPLVSIIVITYNQEQWIEATLDSVFGQTYPNIEWVISDDCSTDSTWQKINDYINNHDVPRDRIVLNRNEHNLKITANYNKCLYDLSHGELLVINEGDDISFPNRVETLVKLHEKHKANLISSLYAFVVDKNLYCKEDPKEPIQFRQWNISNYHWHSEIMYSGPTLCISRELVDGFPKMKDTTPWIDSPMTRRAIIFGGGGTSQRCNRQSIIE